MDNILKELEKLRAEKKHSKESADFIIRVCEAIVARKAGYKTRMDWRHLQNQEGI